MANTNGIHVRPSRVIETELAPYSETVTLASNGMKISSINMINLLSLGLKTGDTVEITVSGAQEQQVFDQIVKLLETHFDFPTAETEEK